MRNAEELSADGKGNDSLAAPIKLLLINGKS
jgi:hypothetical protein